MKKVKVAPFDVLNIVGLNTLTLDSTANPLSEEDFVVRVQISREDENENGPLAIMGNFGIIPVNTEVNVPAELAGKPDQIADFIISNLKLRK